MPRRGVLRGFIVGLGRLRRGAVGGGHVGCRLTLVAHGCLVAVQRIHCNHRRRIKTEGEGKGRRCWVGDVCT